MTTMSGAGTTLGVRTGKNTRALYDLTDWGVVKNLINELVRKNNAYSLHDLIVMYCEDMDNTSRPHNKSALIYRILQSCTTD